MTSTSRACPLLCCCLLAAGTGLAQVTYTPVTFSCNAPMSERGNNPWPRGAVTLGGMPFTIPTTGSDFWSADAPHMTGPNPRVLEIVVQEFAVSRVFTLINTAGGVPGGPYASIEFWGNGGAYYKKDFYGNVDIRDWLFGNWTNSINNTTTTNVFMVNAGQLYSEARVDMQTIALPAEFLSQTLIRIRLSDTGSDTTQRLQLSGVTLQSQYSTKVLPQLAFGDGWYSALYFANTGNNKLSFTVDFISNGGTPMSVPSAGGPSAVVTLAAHGSAIVEVPDTGSLSQGYARMLLPTGVEGYGIFRQRIPGVPDQEAVVPLSGVASKATTLIWDDTVYTTAVAIANPSAVPTSVSVVVRDSAGTVIGTSLVPVAARSKMAAVLRSLPGLGAVAGNRGSADFTVETGNVAVLGLRFNGVAFTSIPTADR